MVGGVHFVVGGMHGVVDGSHDVVGGGHGVHFSMYDYMTRYTKPKPSLPHGIR